MGFHPICTSVSTVIGVHVIDAIEIHVEKAR